MEKNDLKKTENTALYAQIQATGEPNTKNEETERSETKTNPTVIDQIKLQVIR